MLSWYGATTTAVAWTEEDDMVDSPETPAGTPPEPATNLAEVAVDLTLGLLAVGASGLRMLPDLAAKVPVRAASAALVASERAQRDLELLLVRGGEVRSSLREMVAGRLLGPPIIDDEPTEVDPFDLLFIETEDDGEGEPAAPRVPNVVVVTGDEEIDDGLPLLGFDAMSLGAMRAQARHLTIPELEALLEHERTHGRRDGVLALLETRIAQLHLEQSGS